MKKKLYSTIMILVMMVAALSLNACGGNGDDDEIGVDGGGYSSTTLKDLKGNWTTVSCSYIPESIDDFSLANVSFLIDYDGIYHFWSSKLGYGAIKSMTDLEKYIRILSYKQTEIKVQVPKYSNAELVMKKFGTLDDADYKYKLCNGAWIVGYDSESNRASYVEVGKDVNLSNEARKWPNEDYYRLLRFKDDGTGECAYYTMTGVGYHTFYYTFSWELRDKTITMTKEGVEKQSKITLQAIEGEVEMVFQNTIW